MKAVKITGIIVFVYLFIGFVTTLIVPYHSKPCLPCPAGVFCGLCSPFEEKKYTINADLFTIQFWRSIVFWPVNLLEYNQLLEDTRVGRSVRVNPYETDTR